MILVLFLFYYFDFILIKQQTTTTTKSLKNTQLFWEDYFFSFHEFEFINEALKIKKKKNENN